MGRKMKLIPFWISVGFILILGLKEIIFYCIDVNKKDCRQLVLKNFRYVLDENLFTQEDKEWLNKNFILAEAHDLAEIILPKEIKYHQNNIWLGKFSEGDRRYIGDRLKGHSLTSKEYIKLPSGKKYGYYIDKYSYPHNFITCNCIPVKEHHLPESVCHSCYTVRLEKRRNALNNNVDPKTYSFITNNRSKLW